MEERIILNYIILILNSIESLMALLFRVGILIMLEVKVDSQFMAGLLMIRALPGPILVLAYSPWPIVEEIPTPHSFLSP